MERASFRKALDRRPIASRPPVRIATIGLLRIKSRFPWNRRTASFARGNSNRRAMVWRGGGGGGGGLGGCEGGGCVGGGWVSGGGVGVCFWGGGGFVGGGGWGGGRKKQSANVGCLQAKQIKRKADDNTSIQQGGNYLLRNLARDCMML